jgi:hypothetical protein
MKLGSVRCYFEGNNPWHRWYVLFSGVCTL